jgi:type VI secretion system secreted protein Hcp
MAFDAFLWFPSAATGATYTPKGETTDRGFAPMFAFEITSFGFSVKNNVKIGSGKMGAGAGKAEFEKFTFEKNIDTGSPNLFAACATGKHIPAAYLALRKAGGAAVAGGLQPVYLLYKFLLCYIDSVTWSGSSGDDIPKETVTFAYGAMQINYKMQSSTGGVGTTNYSTAWSQTNNRNKFECTAGASGTIADPASTVPGW